MDSLSQIHHAKFNNVGKTRYFDLHQKVEALQRSQSQPQSEFLRVLQESQFTILKQLRKVGRLDFENPFFIYLFEKLSKILSKRLPLSQEFTTILQSTKESLYYTKGVKRKSCRTQKTVIRFNTLDPKYHQKLARYLKCSKKKDITARKVTYQFRDFHEQAKNRRLQNQKLCHLNFMKMEQVLFFQKQMIRLSTRKDLLRLNTKLQNIIFLKNPTLTQKLIKSIHRGQETFVQVIEANTLSRNRVRQGEATLKKDTNPEFENSKVELTAPNTGIQSSSQYLHRFFVLYYLDDHGLGVYVNCFFDRGLYMLEMICSDQLKQ